MFSLRVQTNVTVCVTLSTVNIIGGNLTKNTKLNIFKKYCDQNEFLKNYYIKLNIDQRNKKNNYSLKIIFDEEVKSEVMFLKLNGQISPYL